MNNIICIRENLKIAKTWLFDIWSFSKNPDPSRVGILRTHTALQKTGSNLSIGGLNDSVGLYIYIYTSPFLSPCQIICNGVEFLSTNVEFVDSLFYRITHMIISDAPFDFSAALYIMGVLPKTP